MDTISAYREVGTCRSAADLSGNTHKTVKRVIEVRSRTARHDSTERVDLPHRGRISARRLLPIARTAGYEGSDRNIRRLVAEARC